MTCDLQLLLMTQRVAALLLTVSLLTPTPAISLERSSGAIIVAHGGHGNEFQDHSPSAESAGAIQVDGETANRLGLKVESVSRQQMTFGIKATGTVEALPNETVEVTTPVTGTVIKLLVNPGDRVEVGQPVAIMTTPELAELRTTALDRRAEAIASVQEAEAELQLARQTYQQQRKIVTASIQQARTEVSVAQERYDKDQQLLSNGAIPRRTVLESETQLATAKAAAAKANSALDLSQAEAQLQRAQAGVNVAQSRMALSDATYQTRLRQLGASPNPDGTITLKAAIAGIVADRETTQGESGQDAGKKVMTIINSRRVQVSGNVYEKDLDRIQPGQGIRVHANGASNRIFNGRIRVIGAVVEGATRVVPIKATLDNPDGALKPGMFVELDVLTDRTPVAVLAIPKSAIVETTDQHTIVFVQNGSAFQPSEVTLGRDAGDRVEVKSGLFDGDRIVTQRAIQLYAQSLQRTGKEPALSVDPDGGTDEKPPSSQNSAIAEIPLWTWVATAGLSLGAAFWAGLSWAKRNAQSLASSAVAMPESMPESIPEPEARLRSPHQD